MRYLLSLLCFMVASCADTIPTTSRCENSEVCKYSWFFKQNLKQISKDFDSYPLETQVDIAIYGVEYIHPPVIGMEYELEKRGVKVIPILVERTTMHGGDLAKLMAYRVCERMAVEVKAENDIHILDKHKQCMNLFKQKWGQTRFFDRQDHRQHERSAQGSGACQGRSTTSYRVCRST